MNFKNRYRILASLCLLCYSGLTPVSAQTTTPEEKWNFLAEVYMLFPNMNGETGIGNTITVPVDANTGDSLSLQR